MKTPSVIILISASLLFCNLRPACSQEYQAPPPFKIHKPAGNTGLETVSYDIKATFMDGELPLRADVTIEVENGDQNPQSHIHMYLHPDLQVDHVVTTSGDSLAYETRMVEYWLATTLLARELAIILPEPLHPGDTTMLEISYQGSLNSSTARGSKSDGYIGITEEKAFLRLFGYCQWLPQIHTMPNGTRDLAMFRMEANIPSNLQVVAPGVEIQGQVTDGRRVSVWNTLYPVSLTQYSVWIDSWKVHSEGDLRVYYHDNEDATRDYLNTCITILNWYKKLYSAGLPIDNLEVPYSIVQLDVPSGGYESQNMVGFARSRFLGQFSYSDLTWISHEMINGFITVPVEENQPGSVLIMDGFNLFFNLPVLEKMIGPEFRHWDLERRWKQYENGLQRGSDGEGPLPPDKPLAEITSSEYIYYKDRFLTADKEQIILWRLLEIIGEEDFFAAYQDYLKEHREKPATLESFRAALEKTSGKDLEEFFYRWFYTTEKLPEEWRPGY